MTCIVGIEADGQVHLGADSAGVAGYSVLARADEKVFRRGPFVLGFTSSFRMGQLLRYRLEVPDRPDGQDETEFMATAFVDACRACFKDGGFARLEYGVETGGMFLVGYHGHLFTVGGDYQVGRSLVGFDAIGCGQDLALGAVAATPGLRPRPRIRRALEIAAQFSGGVCGPFNLIAGR